MDTASGALHVYPSTQGLYHLTTQAEGHTVYYTLRIPAGYDGHTALPVILCLHFGGQPTEWYGGRFLNLIPLPGLGSLVALLVAPTTAQGVHVFLQCAGLPALLACRLLRSRLLAMCRSLLPQQAACCPSARGNSAPAGARRLP